MSFFKKQFFIQSLTNHLRFEQLISTNQQFIIIYTYMDQIALEKQLNEKRAELKTLQEKFELNNKKIKLLRKENEEMKTVIERNSQSDTTMLLHSKQLSDANSKLQAAIQELQLKMKEPIQAPIPQFATIRDVTITNQTLQVDLAGKQLTDEEFSEIAPFSKLESLIVDSNLLTNTSVELICSNLKNLKKLLLNSNKFTSAALNNVGNLSQMRSIQIANNQLGDQCMNYLVNLTASLVELSVPKNLLTDNAAALLPKFEYLSYLDITNNQLTDQGTKDIGRLKKLTHLYIGWNKVTHIGARWLIKDLVNLQALDLRFNAVDKDEKEKIKGDKPNKLQLFC